MVESPDAGSSGSSERPNPSLRRILAGYLRLRSPFSLVIDAAIVLVASYLLSSAHQWTRVGLMNRPPEEFSAWWALNELVTILASFLFYASTAMFFVACARIIAERSGRAA
jgi:hypothetical protein